MPMDTPKANKLYLICLIRTKTKICHQGCGSTGRYVLELYLTCLYHQGEGARQPKKATGSHILVFVEIKQDTTCYLLSLVLIFEH